MDPGRWRSTLRRPSGLPPPTRPSPSKTGSKRSPNGAGYMASFMTKPYADQSASGCHLPSQPAGPPPGRQRLLQPGEPAELTRRACRWWIGGQIAPCRRADRAGFAHGQLRQALQAVLLRPNQRHLGLREPHVSACGIKGLKGEGAHVENRLPGGASNPYLVMAGVLAAGLDGLRNHIEPPPPVDGIAYGLTDVTDLPSAARTGAGRCSKRTRCCRACWARSSPSCLAP